MNKTFSVKQIAAILDTNPETVRRWIRDKKLSAVQVSRKGGNIVTDDELERFLKETPKYAPRFAAYMTLLSPVVGITALVGGLGIEAIEYFAEKKTIDTSILTENFCIYLKENLDKIQEQISQKRETIMQLQEEVANLEHQAEVYKYLLKRGGFLCDTKDAEKKSLLFERN